MGKVVRSAELGHGPYVLRVPHAIAYGDGSHEPLPAVGRSFDLESVIRDSGKLIDDAADDARKLLEDAQERAARILAKAREDAEDLERAARENGQAVGRADALRTVEEEVREAREALKGILEAADRQRRSYVESAEGEIVRLAYAVAERIVSREIEREPGVAVDVTRSAIKRLIDRERVVMRANPEDLDRIRLEREELLAAGDIQEIRVIGDPRVDRGGIVLETEAGMIDARVAAQSREVQRVLGISEEGGESR